VSGPGADGRGGTVRKVRVALAGVAPKPWRNQEAELALRGQPCSRELANQAAEAALRDAKPLSKIACKVPLTRMLVRRAVEEAVTGRKSACGPAGTGEDERLAFREGGGPFPHGAAAEVAGTLRPRYSTVGCGVGPHLRFSAAP